MAQRLAIAPTGDYIERMAHPSLLPPVLPYQGTRQIDGFGAGGFGAPRGKRKHRGLDFIGQPGDRVQVPLDARVTPPHGQAYADGTCDLRSIHLRGERAFVGLRVVLLYAAPEVANDSIVLAGAPLGVMQDVAGYHMKKAGESRIMTNHCHFELYEQVGGVWELRDPTDYLLIPRPACDD